MLLKVLQMLLVLQTFAVWDFKPPPFQESSSPAATACKRKKEKVPSEIIEKLGPPCLWQSSFLSPHSRVWSSLLKDGHGVVLQVVSHDEPESSQFLRMNIDVSLEMEIDLSLKNNFHLMRKTTMKAITAGFDHDTHNVTMIMVVKKNKKKLRAQTIVVIRMR